jgi:RNA polymerase sigma-70 factor (ECF subfamily)
MMWSSLNEFTRLVEAHRPAVYRFLLASVQDEEVAESLTQECFLKAFRNGSSFRGESSVRTWLIRIAINLKTDFWRSRRLQFWRETQASTLDEDFATDCLASAEKSPEAQLIVREQTSLIWRAVETLSPRERSVFLLRYVEELRLREIGQSTNLKVDAVKVYLQRALKKIRTVLDESDKIHRTKPVEYRRYSPKKRSNPELETGSLASARMSKTIHRGSPDKMAQAWPKSPFETCIDRKGGISKQNPG